MRFALRLTVVMIVLVTSIGGMQAAGFGAGPVPGPLPPVPGQLL